MTYERMSQYSLDTSDDVELTDAHFGELFEDLSIVINAYLLPGGKYDIAQDVAFDAMHVHSMKNPLICDDEKKECWLKMARKYNFYPNDAFDDVWMNVKLSTLDRAGLEP